MKKVLIKVCSIALCIVPFFCLASCGESDNATPIEDSSQIETEDFSPIADLRLAIRKNPTEYNNKQVSLKGTILKEDDGKILLLDYHRTVADSTNSTVTGDDIRYNLEERLKAKNKPSIEVILSDNIQSYVVESWDYVELKGIVKISNESIYLDDCECTIIIAHEE